MRHLWRGVAASLLMLGAPMAMADSLDLNLHNTALRVTYTKASFAGKGLDLEIGHMYNEDNDFVTHAGLHVSGENWSKSGVFNVGMGGRAVMVNTTPGDASALAIGVRVRFSPVNRVGIGGSAYFAPDVTTFMDGKAYREFDVRADYQVLPQGLVYLGYRQIAVELQNISKEVKLDDAVHVGMQIVF